MITQRALLSCIATVARKRLRTQSPILSFKQNFSNYAQKTNLLDIKPNKLAYNCAEVLSYLKFFPSPAFLTTSTFDDTTLDNANGDDTTPDNARGNDTTQNNAHSPPEEDDSPAAANQENLVRVIDETGQNLGLIAKSEAESLAKGKSLVLKLVNPAKTPEQNDVYRILSNSPSTAPGKKKGKQKQTVSFDPDVKTKEVMIKGGIGQKDLEGKLTTIDKFLEKGFQVKINISKARAKSKEPISPAEHLQLFQSHLKNAHPRARTSHMKGKGDTIVLSIIPPTELL